MADKKVSDFTAWTTTDILDADIFSTVDISGPSSRKMTMRQVKDVVLAERGWLLIATSKYTAAPTNTYTLAMSDTSDMYVGAPIKYVIATVTYYGMVTALTVNTSITVAGASLSGNLTALYVGTPEMLVQIDYFIAGTYGNGADATLLATDEDRYVIWNRKAARLVRFLIRHVTDDTGAAQPKININVNAAAVSTKDTNNGFPAATTWTVPATTDLVAISTTNYDVQFGEAVDVNCTVAGTNGDAANLTVTTLWVME